MLHGVMRKATVWLAAAGLVAALAATTQAAEWHVTTGGTPGGDGSRARPWDVATALAHPETVQPGDTIWLHGGVYEPAEPIKVRLQGEKDKPIIVRNYQHQRVTLRAPLSFATLEKVPTRYCWVWGLEIQTAGAKAAGNPINIGSSKWEPGFNPGIRIINCIAHDSPSNGLGCWGSAEEEVYGCLIYNNGSDGDLNSDSARGHGHGFYIQSKTHKAFRDNIVFRQFFLGFQIYGTSAAELNGVTLEGNTFFNNGEMSLIQNRRRELPVAHVGGGSRVNGARLIENYVYTPAWAVKATSNMGGTSNCLIQGNYLVAPGRTSAWPWTFRASAAMKTSR